MLEVMIEDITGFSISGLRVTATHDEESFPGTARMPQVWNDFDHRVGPLLQLGASVYSVYTNFRGRNRDIFDLVVGAQPSDLMLQPALDTVLIPGGKYLTFARFGVMPDAATELWDYIANYFSYSDCPYSRAYLTDFECYHSDHSLTIHISVEQFL